MNLLSSYLAATDIVLALQASDKPTLFHAIGRHMERSRGLAADLVASSLMRREQAATTAIGEGVPIPHARISDLERVHALYVRLTRAIPFDAPDEKPVSDVWVLLVPAPAARTHLELLASVAQLVLDSAFRAALLRCNDAEEIVRLIGRWDDPSPRAADSPLRIEPDRPSGQAGRSATRGVGRMTVISRRLPASRPLRGLTSSPAETQRVSTRTSPARWEGLIDAKYRRPYRRRHPVPGERDDVVHQTPSIRVQRDGTRRRV